MLCLDPENGEQPFKNGVAVIGRVLHSDGTPAPGIPVTLTMNDRVNSGMCQAFIVRVSQVLTTDTNGDFNFDFVMAGIPYTISATDTGGLSSNALAIIEQATIGQGPDQGLLMQWRPTLHRRPSSSCLSSLTPAASSKPSLLSRACSAWSLMMLWAWVPVAWARLFPSLLGFQGLPWHRSRQVVAADGVTGVPQYGRQLVPGSHIAHTGLRGLFGRERRFFFRQSAAGTFLDFSRHIRWPPGPGRRHPLRAQPNKPISR